MGALLRRPGDRDAAAIARTWKRCGVFCGGAGRFASPIQRFPVVLAFSLVTLILAGSTMMMQFTSTNTLIQAMVPDRLRGRVMSLYSMMFLGMTPIGSLLAGKIADRVGALITVANRGHRYSRRWPGLCAQMARHARPWRGNSSPHRE